MAILPFEISLKKPFFSFFSNNHNKNYGKNPGKNIALSDYVEVHPVRALYYIQLDAL